MIEAVGHFRQRAISINPRKETSLSEKLPDFTIENKELLNLMWPPGLWAIYEQCRQLDPNLAFAKIKKANLQKRAAYWVMPTDENPQIGIVVSGEQEHFNRLLQTSKISIQEICQTHGLDSDLLEKPENLALLIFAHELGHVKDFFERGQLHADSSLAEVLKAAKKYKLENRKEKQRLPVPRKNPRTVNAYGNAKLFYYFLRHKQRLRRMGINNYQEIPVEQERRYRQLPLEKTADEFSVTAFKRYLESVSL